MKIVHVGAGWCDTAQHEAECHYRFEVIWSVLFCIYHSDLQRITVFHLLMSHMSHILRAYSCVVECTWGQVSSCYHLHYSCDKHRSLTSISHQHLSLSLSKCSLSFSLETSKCKLLCPEDFPVMGNFAKHFDCYKVLTAKTPSINV